MVKRFLSVLFLSVLFVLTSLKSPIYARVDDCSSCTKSNCCGVPCGTNQSCSGSVFYGCSCVSSGGGTNPTPTTAQQPTKPPPSPTTQPTTAPTATPGGLSCNNITPGAPESGGCISSTYYCMWKYCGCTCTSTGVINCDSGCSSYCNNGYCYTTRTTPTPDVDIPCDPNGWGSWTTCTCDQGAYAGCSQTNYCGQVRYCVNPPNSNQYQINCCTPGSGLDGTNSNTTIPT